MKDFSQRLLSSIKTWRWLLILGGGVWLALMVLLHFQSAWPVGFLTRDPAAIAHHNPFFGALSNIGILLWSASAAVCGLSAAVLNIIQPISDSRLFFGLFAGLSAALCLDDTFLLHEAILPNRLPLVHIPEAVVILSYVLVLIGAIVRFRKLLLDTSVWLFGLSLGCFAIAAGFDQILPPNVFSEDITFLIEDGFKLLAIFLWLAYFVRASMESIVEAVEQHA
ncbi:MAG: hypothetical protein AAFO84_05330 [Cyanobacteria bacterium J06598_1]